MMTTVSAEEASLYAAEARVFNFQFFPAFFPHELVAYFASTMLLVGSFGAFVARVATNCFIVSVPFLRVYPAANKYFFRAGRRRFCLQLQFLANLAVVINIVVVNVDVVDVVVVVVAAVFWRQAADGGGAQSGAASERDNGEAQAA